MKKLLLLCFSFVFVLNAWAQERMITGKVTSAEDGSALPGVSVVVKGTTNGTVTDTDGRYSVNVPSSGASLVFSFVGLKTAEVAVAERSSIDVQLSLDITQLGEVVVTALGVSKDAKKIGYATATVNGDQLDKARTTNVAVALQGTVAGLSVRGTSSGPGGTAKILLRGLPSMNGNGSPLFVINGVPMDNSQRGSAGEWGGADGGDGIGNLNPDDIETMTVLKGQSASALYGARAANGVIMITTKKGKKGDYSVDYNMNYVAETAMNNTDFQYVYGQGINGVKPTNAADAQANSRFSWGAKLDGSQVIQFDGNQYPYSAQKDNIKNFYRTGGSLTNTIAVSKGGENGSVRLSVSNLASSSIVPNSGLDRKTINLNLDQKITEKLSINLVANYINEQSKNRPNLSDGPMNANNGMFLATNIDQRILAPGYNPTTGVETRWGNDEYVTNPYFVTSKFINNLGRERLISSLAARYEITSWLYAQARVGYDLRSDRKFTVTPTGTAYTQGFAGKLDELSQAQTYELNIDGLIGVSKKLTNDISLDALLGANGRKNESEYVGVSGSPFVIPNLYTPNNVLNFGRSYDYTKTGVNSAYYSVDFGYKGFLTIGTTGRWDDYSTLYSPTNPNKETSLFVPSVSTGFIFSELFDAPALNFGKLRASWAQTSGEPTTPYQTSLYYSTRNSLGGIPIGDFSTTAPNSLLKPYICTEIEIGTDLKFFQNRLAIDLAWYTRETKNEIMNANFSPTTGARSGFIGTGSTRNSGVEILVKGMPIKTNDFSWEISVNATTVKNEILSTDDGNRNVNIGSNRGTLGNAVTAYVVGAAAPQIMAYDYKRNASGQIIVDASGLPVRGELVKMGTVLPTLYGGVNNQVNYKAFSLSFLIDYGFGNKVLSATEYYSILRGLHKMTLEGRETGVTTGVYENGQVNTVAAAPQDYYRAVAQQITSSSVVSGDFIKLRQLALSYNVPASALAKLKFIRGVQISLTGRNLAILMRDSKNIDPEASFGSNLAYSGIEGVNLPSTRSYGFNLNVKF